MSEGWGLILALVTGIFLGIFFFSVLWWTVKKVVKSSHPAFWFLSSFVLRIVIVVVGFYLVSGESWQRWLLCLFGFFIVRLIIKHVIGIREESILLKQVAHHAN